MYFVIWRKSGIFRSDRSKKVGLIRRYRKNETADVTSSGWLASQLFPLPPEKKEIEGVCTNKCQTPPSQLSFGRLFARKATKWEKGKRLLPALEKSCKQVQ